MNFAFLTLLILIFCVDKHESYHLTDLEDLQIEREESLLRVDYDFFSLKHPDIEEADTDGYDEVTESSTGCACWFDPKETFTSAGDCACCTSEGTQCGYPMHNYCQPKVASGEEQTGCSGILDSNF